MKNRFLLYIDILGFSDIVKENPKKIKEIYAIVNSLNAHKHDAFQTIIFSDTILVYNKLEAISDNNKKSIVMYMIEFAQDLLFKGVSIDMHFRAILTYGEFEHYNLDNVECYFGKSLIYAYEKEKNINGIGLFIDSKINTHNHIFQTCKYDSDFNFVFLLQTLIRIKNYGLTFPISRELIEPTDEYCWLEDEITILSKYFDNIKLNVHPKVRAKHLQTYEFYRNLLPNEFSKLEQNAFSMSTVNANISWKTKKMNN